jgi:hypothetical protein
VAKKTRLKNYPSLEMVLSMAFSRDRWVDKVRHRLEGALGEYAKQKFAEAIGYTGWDWTIEVETILAGVSDLMNTKKVQTKTKFDRKKAFQEAYQDAQGSYDQIVHARNTLCREHPFNMEQYQRIRLVKLDADTLLREMVLKFLPGILN